MTTTTSTKTILCLKGEEIPVTLAYREGKKSSRISFVIDVFGDVRVSAPLGMPFPVIESALEKNAPMILNARRRGREKLAGRERVDYREGAFFYFLGGRYSLRLFSGTEAAPSIRLREGTLSFTAKRRDSDFVRRHLDAWYGSEAIAYFNREIKSLLKTNPGLTWVTKMPLIKVRKMKRQWGNCRPSGIITLNVHLIKVPPDLIRYVLAHELCHLREANHGARFYQLLTAALPRHRELRRELKEHTFHLFDLV